MYLGGTTSLTVATFSAGDMQQFLNVSDLVNEGGMELVIGSLGSKGV